MTKTLPAIPHDIPALMDIETATAIREAFGPNTGLFECNTPGEMVAYAKLNTMTPAAFASVSLTVDGIAHEGSEEEWENWKEWRDAIKARLLEIGITIA